MGLPMTMNNHLEEASSSGVQHDGSTSSLSRIRLRNKATSTGARSLSMRREMETNDDSVNSNQKISGEGGVGGSSSARFNSIRRLSRPKLPSRSQSFSVRRETSESSTNSVAAAGAVNDDGGSSSISPKSGKKRSRRRRFSSSVNSGSGSSTTASERMSSSSRSSTRRLSLDFLRRRSSTKPSSDHHAVGCDSSDSSGNNNINPKGGSCTEESDEDSNLGTAAATSLFSRTKVIPEAISPTSATADSTTTSHDDGIISGGCYDEEAQEEGIEVEPGLSSSGNYACAATAILKHSYLENLCGIHTIQSSEDGGFPDLPEDPTVQESIECIFASQLEDGLKLWDDDDETPKDFKHGPDGLVSPAFFQQSRQNRTDRGTTSGAEHTSLSQSKQRYQQASLAYLGTYDPTIPDNEKPSMMSMMDNETDTLLCPCSKSPLPALHPEDWPQAPLLLRPTAGKGMKIKGVRLSDTKEYLWEPGSNLSWEEILAKKWGKPCKPKPHYACCEHCALLPINNGNEDIGKALVTDFESDHFEGTLLLRLRYSQGTTPEPYNDKMGYFRGMNRRYQAVVRGRFKKHIPLTELKTGFQLDRPCGRLPGKLILRGGLKVVKFFAPQLDAKLEGNRPHCLTPLGSTPQSISLDAKERDLIDGIREEPKEANQTLLGTTSTATASIQRARNRKKEFDKLFVNDAKDPKTDPTKIYTFEFLQHLFDFQDFSIELGSMLGKVDLEDILAGQPLQIMAAHGKHPIFSFDIWHKCLWEKAKKHATS